VILVGYSLTTIRREAEKLSNLLRSYEEHLSVLPKGSIHIKGKDNSRYYYLSYRKDSKVVTKYIGNDEATLGGLKEQLERRKDVERLVKAIRNELKKMNKALEVVK
jgi:hypothetical protein